MPELLLELFSEEIPARMQGRAAAELRALLARSLNEAELAFEDAAGHATPRRLCLVVSGLAARQPDVEVERRGPRVGASEKAVEGFLGGLGTDEYALEERDDRKGRVYVARFTRGGRPAAEVVGPLVADVMARFPWPKSMRWGREEARWVRPLHGILCLLDGEVVPVRFGPVESGAVTRGHRFMAPEPFEVAGYDDYRARLRQAFVMLGGAERKRVIADGVARLAQAEGLSLRPDDALMDELAGLVEWPVPLIGRIDERFMELPPEVLVTSMRQHQRYLALEDAADRLAPRFVLVANIRARDGGQAIVAGNERVLRARLWDAEFFWNQDRREPLDGRVPALAGVVFHAGLGSLGDRAARLQTLAAWLAERVPDADRELAARAGLLCKADLVTGMVGEFPELQGVMGRYYALADREPEPVATAIAEHYSPKGPSDACPTAPVSVAVALADKLDTLTGFFAIGERPTGSKDPFALRRAALSVIRLILENRLRLPLLRAFERSLAGYGDRLAGVDHAALSNELLDFFADRLKVHLRGAGVRHDLIGAVFAAGREDDLVRLLARVEALAAFLATEDGANLLTAYRRASNIVRIEEKRDRRSYAGVEPNPALFQRSEERELYVELDAASREIEAALGREDFVGAMAALARLRRPVDAFFDHVTVNTEDPALRENRLGLLSRIRSALGTLADFDEIEDVGIGATTAEGGRAA